MDVNTKAMIAAIAIALAVVVVGVVVIVYSFSFLGPTAAWSVFAGFVVAVSVTLAFTSISLTQSKLHLSSLHACISQQSSDYFEKTITAIRANGEETRKTLLEAHKSMKEELSKK